MTRRLPRGQRARRPRPETGRNDWSREVGPQELATWVDVVKDLLGGTGAVLAAIPWFADFRRRIHLTRLERVPAADPQAAKLIEQTRTTLRRWHEGPSMRDLGYQVGGLVLIAASFAVSLTKALFLG